MFIVEAQNVTHGGLTRQDGTADYQVWVGINDRCIWQGIIANHVRKAGGAQLLRAIADKMDFSNSYPPRS
jgi:hypothetical protein